MNEDCCCKAQSECVAGRFLSDGQVAWNSASARARLPNIIFNGLHDREPHTTVKKFDSTEP